MFYMNSAVLEHCNYTTKQVIIPAKSF